MLVLSRRAGERILVRDQAGNTVAAVTVVRIGPNAVRIGIDAGKELSIVREELVVELDSLLDQLAVEMPPVHKIQADESDIATIGRKPRGEFLEADEVADAFVESEMIDHGC